VSLSLRSRLTIWYSGLLLVALLLFSATVLWLDWHLVLWQGDEALEALSRMASNVVIAELAEHATLEEASRETEALVGHHDYAIAILDASGTLVRRTSAEAAVIPHDILLSANRTPRTVQTANGQMWRVYLRRASSDGTSFTVAVASPLREITEHWRALVKASAIGIPFVLAVAIAGGWVLGRRALSPLADIAAQSRAITARSADQRLNVGRAAPELEVVAQSFNRVLDRLGSAIETQRRFMADASHELRTPVSIMRTAADVTLSQPSREEGEYRDALATVSQQTSRLARLVDDMLMLARGDAGGYAMTRAEVDLDEMVAECIRELGPRAAAKDISLTSELVPVSVMADEALIRRMVENLVINAITYTPGAGTVHVRLASRRNCASLEVTDSGPGIPDADRERVFERFVRLDPARGAGGAGLGLSIARWIAEAHGGRVDLVRSGSNGSVFAVTIPAA
jgi:heavy metal sensor kinase